MKEPKNLRIILVPVGQVERKSLENIENNTFRTNAHIILELHKQNSSKKFEPLILTASEFGKMSVFTKVSKSFSLALANIHKRKQCYNLSEFMDEFNNEEFGGDTKKYWMGYVRLK